ncbi:MAG: hypothetical protein ACQESR_05155 [Planctomycetota bacterium]
MDARGYEERDRNVFHADEAFKARIIELGAGGEIPGCQMASHVVFLVLHGEANIKVDDQDFALGQGKCLITPPASISMRSAAGVRMLGIQIQELSS